ncbi:homoserine dehydrogenase [Ammoniphilus sp. YIM 78166]|uniref:homoserine dehydrogenase n=1 Tax=Ammoniphilus sp. YIM 78166 TaxID=1644106 RepID=UPI00106FB584|nr:homoserine dehydrogenase [Ammoniphilus sp. YIM 78166]
MSTIRVGLLGLGTVGTGVVKTLRIQEHKLSERLGKKVEIVKVLVKNLSKERAVDLHSSLLTTSFDEVLEAKVDVIVEVMGGVEPTFDYIQQAFHQGCHVVTANKELLAKRGEELIQAANRHGVHLFYEASVAGGIPVISVLRNFLRTNDVTRIQGILNGTTNYILTQMEQHGSSYKDVLKEAQALGYAEADPTSDVEGYDALYKLLILSQLVFGRAPQPEDVVREGISGITLEDLRLAREFGYRFKLIAQAKVENGCLQLSVRPTLLSLNHQLAQVQDAFNAVQITANIVGDLLFTGKGAGEFPTASAVVEDLAYLLSQPFQAQTEWARQFEEKVADGSSSAFFVSYPVEQEAMIQQWIAQEGIVVYNQRVLESGRAAVIVGGDPNQLPGSFTVYSTQLSEETKKKLEYVVSAS